MEGAHNPGGATFFWSGRKSLWICVLGEENIILRWKLPKKITIYSKVWQLFLLRIWGRGDKWRRKRLSSVANVRRHHRGGLRGGPCQGGLLNSKGHDIWIIVGNQEESPSKKDLIQTLLFAGSGRSRRARQPRDADGGHKEVGESWQSVHLHTKFKPGWRRRTWRTSPTLPTSGSWTWSATTRGGGRSSSSPPASFLATRASTTSDFLGELPTYINKWMYYFGQEIFFKMELCFVG